MLDFISSVLVYTLYYVFFSVCSLAKSRKSFVKSLEKCFSDEGQNKAELTDDVQCFEKHGQGGIVLTCASYPSALSISLNAL